MIYTEKAYAKINLFLDVLAKREDGYHDIGTLFQTIDAHDILLAEEAPQGVLELSYDRPQDYAVESDLVYRAALALREYTGSTRGVRMHLTKNLPLGAGLGGGSADSAAALRLLNRMWELGLSASQLRAIGARLGADIPFLVEGGSAYATGIGDILEPQLAFHLPPGAVLAVATPLCAVPTKAAYAGIQPSGSARWDTFVRLGERDLFSARFDLFNKFEESVLPQFPPIQNLRAEFTRLGAIRVLMSGSGASVFAIFASESKARASLEQLVSIIRWGTIAQLVNHY